ncbi:TolC family protein [Mucilaginibacter sp. RS28]|uniref:TolC family protein n=1 Tax=Mucilaginibacter straminoryzae TaxID=2932774 RepID=A0A9X2B9B6_9SPHI|nr:TolC family protein [Mucilaginibacter straminoryzae]MCJ8209580.1 TolC family protein [Mucilaginibacter straminoryzae]
MKRIVLTIILLLPFITVFAQDKVLTLDEYLAIVKQYHPLALQARLNEDKAKLTKRQALGGFDPKLEVDQDRKIFGGKTYYDYVTPEVKVPLWYGIDLKGSYAKVTGDYVNPENKTPKDGLGYLGISMPLGKGLFLDERRAAIKQANIYAGVAANEQRQMLNDLFMSATGTYSEWLNAYLNSRIYEKAVELAKVRFEGTRLLYKNGDKPAIDTLEALTLLQSRQQKLTEYQLVLLNRKNELASYMWQEGLSLVDLSKVNVVPDTTLIKVARPDSLLNKDAATVAETHPEVRNYNLKLNQLDVERRLKLEEVKPTLNFNLGVLNTGRNIFQNINSSWIGNNQKFGFTVAMPLTFTKQRAAYSLAKLKLQEARFALLDKQNTLTVKWNNYRNDYYNIENQIKFNSEIQKNNQALLNGEEFKFRLGESSVFMVNSREQKVLDTQEKLNDYYTKRIKTIQYLKWLSNSF